MTANSTDGAGIWNNPAIYGLRILFYAVSPQESSFDSLEKVPNYVAIVTPIFLVMIVLESLIHILAGRRAKAIRWNDALSSVAQGFLSQLPMLLWRSIELVVYIHIYTRWRLAELAWDSAATWWLAMLGVDLAYYWVHRMAHEVNFMWAAHQVHHSSEDYNLSTALRQSVLQKYNSWIFYVPLAFFIPPQVFLVHVQFNLLYQFWIHTELVGRLGPLEWVLNTPSHHRVHHGRNRYCIDRNYAGVLIIWDRIFGTFVAEEDAEQIAYGLVHPVNSWDSIYIQLCHWQYLLGAVRSARRLRHKMEVLFKGPGWAPGKPRLGDIQDIPDIRSKQPVYDRSAAGKAEAAYAWLHFLLALHMRMAADDLVLSVGGGLLLILFFTWTITNLGHIYEQKRWAAASELARCLAALAADAALAPLPAAIRTIFQASAALCLVRCLRPAAHTKAD